jgi:DSF synthase
MRLEISGSECAFKVQSNANSKFNESVGQEATAGAIGGDSGEQKLLRLLMDLGLTELRVELDPGLATVWCFQQHRNRPNFTLPLLKDIRAVQRLITDFHRDYPAEARRLAKFLIWGSDLHGIFNLGGDLSYFVHLAEQADVPRLRAYAMSCIDVCFANYSGLHADVIVGALVAGDALGGGFESALSCDFIVAESAARFGLPEILYGLFPGMGAYSFLSRRLGQAKAEAIILDGRLHEASEVNQLGLVEVIGAPSSGRAEMERHLSKLSRRFDAVLSIYKAKRRSFPVSYQEMIDIVEDWVSATMRLSAKDLRKMKKLAVAQDARLNLSKGATGQSSTRPLS